MTSHQRRRQQLIERFGGKCQRCGYNRCQDALHFHHRSGQKDEDWRPGDRQASLWAIALQPERFNLLCANCHAEVHAYRRYQQERLRREKYTGDLQEIINADHEEALEFEAYRQHKRRSEESV